MNWKLICYLLENFTILRKQRTHFEYANHILFLREGSEDLENTVYISMGTDSEKYYSKSLVIYLKNSKVKSDNFIRLSSENYGEIMNALLFAQSHLNLLSAKLSVAVDNQEVIDICSEYLKCPMFYFDGSYRVLAITHGVEISDDEEWRHMTKQGFLSKQSTKRMQESGDLDLLADKRDPYPYKADYYPFESLVCNIWLDNIFYSRFNMLCIHGSSNELNIQECRIICDNLKRIAKSNKETYSYSGPYINMILDLLRGYPLSEELIRDRLSHMPHLTNSICQLCCIDVDVKKDPQVLKYYASVLSRTLDPEYTVTIEFEGKIVIILHGNNNEDFESHHDSIRSFLREQELRGCTSNYFQRFRALRDYYLQASCMLDNLIQSKKNINSSLFDYSDYFFEYAVSLIPEDQAAAMVSYDIRKLQKEQEEFQFPLIETLKVYLESGCILQNTAERLFIHKNTALYRINHIRSMMKQNLDDPAVQRQLMFSFEILDRHPFLSHFETE